MPAGRTDAELGRRLEELAGTHGEMVRTSEIAEVVASLLATLKGDLSAEDLALFSELESLANYIRSTKTEIAALRPDEVKNEYLPAAADELDAIVAATAEATNTIMDATEVVEEVMGRVDSETSDKLMEATTRIYEACGFQDITGQRITKVVKALQHIEDKVDALVAAFGSETDGIEPGEKPGEKKKDDKPLEESELLQGPQKAGEGQTQAEIDALLASFD